MLKFNLSAAYTIMPEGTYNFLIDDVQAKEDADYGNLDIIVTFKADEGTHREFYSVLKGNVPNEISRRNLSKLYNAAMNSELYEEDVDLESIKGKRIVADITHQSYTSKSGEDRTAAHIGNFQVSALTANEVSDAVSSLEDLFG